MNCSQILPGAVNQGPCSLSIGYFSGNPFVVYASGKDVILLDGHLQHLQTIFGSTCGYGNVKVSCLHCAEAVGKLVVAWGSEVVIFEPSITEGPEEKGHATGVSREFSVEWSAVYTFSLSAAVSSICWKQDGSCLLTGGTSIALWEYTPGEAGSVGDPEEEGGGEGKSGEDEEDSGRECVLKEIWRSEVPSPVTHLAFSPNGRFFATCGDDDCLVKIWYPCHAGVSGIGTPPTHSFCYVAHPHSVRGFVWRRVTPRLPRGCIPNVLLTHCTDNICRLWSHTLAYNKKGCLRFFIAASIDPVADIPFRTTMPLDDQPFIVHWLNNKETTITSKVEKYQKGLSTPLSHYSSWQSFASSVNEEMLQSWVCIDEGEEEIEEPVMVTGSKTEVELSSLARNPAFSSFRKSAPFLSPHSGERPTSAGGSPGGTKSKFTVEQKRALAHLLDEWCSTPDLLLCIHPTVGSLMVWTVEGLDAPPNLERLVHVSFSSCLPHIFPPHLSQSLRLELLQFLIKEPDVLGTREGSAEGGGVAVGTDISLPVPQIRLSSGGSMSTMSHLEVVEDVKKIKSNSTLIIVSSHTNGSLNTWSVELTVQSNYCTSIAGLIHCAGTGGHSSKVDKIHRHPWLPILMTISSTSSQDGGRSTEVRGSGRGTGAGDKGVVPQPPMEASELIIWNADLPGPLQHKSKLNELSRVLAPGVRSFDYVTWVPPISVGGVDEGALARCPCSGLFIANVGTKLTLFQASLYSITKPQPSSFMQSDKSKEQSSVLIPSSHWLHDIKVTSQLGTKGIGVVNVITSLLDFETIVNLHAFRMCSLITTLDLQMSLDSRFNQDVVLVLVENRRPGQDPTHNQSTGSTMSPGSKGTKSYVHLWRLTLYSKSPDPPSPVGTGTRGAGSGKHDHLHDYSASVQKVFVGPFPLPSGTCVVDSAPACDISSSLQLQTPTISAPFLFSTSCSDGTIRCWQFQVKGHPGGPSPPPAKQSVEEDRALNENGHDDNDYDDMEFSFYEVFNSSTKVLDSALKPSPLDCYEEEVIKSLPTRSFVPSEFKVAYPGRLSMAHHLSKPINSSLHRNSVSFERPSRTSIVKGNNPLDRYAVVTVWECESSGGLKWSCEANILLAGPAQIGSRSGDMGVLMEWIPMENGAYLLATCFASKISIFGMSLPQDEEHFIVQRKRVGFLPREKTAVLNKVNSQASWVCLLQFPCFRPSLDQGITCLAYTGSNSIMLSIGSEIHLYSCWVHGENLVSFTPSERERKKLSKGPFSRTFIKDGTPSQSTINLAESEVVNLLDYAHARNTPLPQYHPKILKELMNSGKLHAVKTILVNLVMFLLLYESKKTVEEGGARNYFDNEEMMESEDHPKNLLTLSDDGYLHRSKYAKPKSYVESIPHLPLAKMGIMGVGGASDEGGLAEPPVGAEDDYNELFTVGGVAGLDEPKFGFDDEETELELSFAELEPEKGDFTTKQAQKLASLLRDLQLADLSDLEQVQLLAIAETVASTKMSFSDVGATPADSGTGAVLSGLSGAGYAASGGTKGREAMDACGLRYLLALESYITLSQSLPEEMSPGPLPPSVLVWAFHSDAEMELLSAIPCVQKDELRWEELRNAGVGWWLRNLDTLRRLVEKLAKAQFMRNQEPLDAGLFYLAMKKQSLLKGLFRSVADSKKAAFFSNNFAEGQWKNKAQKNAFVLLGKQRFEEAAAFFLLADKLWDAVEVCISNLGDYQLAFVVIRLYEGDHGPIYQRFLKEFILGVQSSPQPNNRGKGGAVLQCNPDPFLRSMVYWLLQDCSSALETLLVHPETTPTSMGPAATPLTPAGPTAGTNSPALSIFYTNPAIFNFYFYLRTHPLLVRRDNKMATSSFLSAQSLGVSSKQSSKGYLSGVGDEPLTAVERGLLFSTAYYHLCHGCPLLALNVLSRLPNTENLGRDICDVPPGAEAPQQNGEEHHPEGNSLTGMIESGTLSSNFTSDRTDDFDWGAPVLDQGRRYGQLEEEEEEIDFSMPLLPSASSRFSGSEEIDWSKPFSSSQRFSTDSPTLSPPTFSNGSNNGDDTSIGESYRTTTAKSSPSLASSLTTRGLFVLTLAGQLQYNACLSILTEELHSIYLPACCHFLWDSEGREALPILPLSQPSVDSDLSLVQHYEKNALDKTVQNLRGMLIEWLRGETRMVKEVCRMEEGPVRQGTGVEQGREGGQSHSKPAGYDLLTTLMNYASLHAATSPSLLTVKFELMHLMNTLLPWSTGTAAATPGPRGNKATPMKLGTSLEVVPTCAVTASQLPVLSSCTLPVKHLSNLATHLRLLSSCIVKELTEHTFPPIASQPLPQVAKVFELCCAISHCITVSLNPTLLSDCSLERPGTPKAGLTSSMGSQGHTPTPSSPLVDMLHHQHQPPEARTTGSPLLRQRMDSFSNLDSTLGTPNTKPAKWPGVSAWPQTLTSDEGRDPTPLSVVLVECVVSVYLGLLATAWSQHSIKDLLVLLKNGPSMDMWYSTVGGGVIGKKADKVLSKNFVSQTLDNVSKKFRKTKRPSPSPNEGEDPLGVFVAPKKTMLDQFLSLPEEEGRRREREGVPRMDMGGFLMVGREEDEESSEDEVDEEDLDEEAYSSEAITFTIGGEKQHGGLMGGASSSETSAKDPNCFAWCLMNVCISKLLQQVMRKMVNGVGLELMELVTVSPLLYSTLKILDDWESIFTRRLEALGEAPDDLFGFSDDVESSPRFRMGVTLMRHKFILEPENSPFRSKDKGSKNAKKLWQYLVHQDNARETIIHYIFVNKGTGRSSSPLGSVDTDELDSPQEPACKVIHKEHDNTVSAFCLNSCSRAQMTVLALALPREVIEIEVPDNSLLDTTISSSSSEIGTKFSPKRTMSLAPGKNDDYIMIQSTAHLPRPKTSAFGAARRSIGSIPGLSNLTASSPLIAHGQTGSNASLLIRRPTAGVKRMAPHPSLAYYLTGSLDGSVTMWEFGTPRSVATQREPGMGGGVTKIRFTPEGNKFGVTDSSGKLSLWQGIQTSNKNAYHILHSCMKYLSDFLFLGSSSFIATCGDGIETRNLYLWDTLMPTNRSIVKEFTCHDGGATSLGYSLTKQRLFSGGKRGEICIFDIRQSSLLHCISVHNSSINCIAVNDIDGYFVTGASDGDIKVIDSSTLTELAHFPSQHSKSRLFRHGEGGVADLDIMPGGKIYSCGADGSVKCQTLKL